MKLLSFIAASISALTACLAAFLLCASNLYVSRLTKLHFEDMPQTRVERLVKAGDVDGLRADFDRALTACNASFDATANVATNLRTLSFFTLLSVCLSSLAWWKASRASRAQDKVPAD